MEADYSQCAEARAVNGSVILSLESFNNKLALRYNYQCHRLRASDIHHGRRNQTTWIHDVS